MRRGLNLSQLQASLLEAVGEALVVETRRQMVLAGPTLPGYPGLEDSDLYDRINYVVEGSKVVLVLPEHYAFVEAGRRAGAKGVPISALLEWMRRKGIDPGNRNSRAWAIQSSIRRRGIRPRPFLRAAIDNFSPDVAVFETEVDRRLKEILNSTRQ